MVTLPHADGDEITEGIIYRRIPNRETHFEREAGIPTYFAFFPRPQDHGVLSAYLKDYVSEEEARTDPNRPGDRTFGLCELDIAKIRTATQEAVSVRYAPSTQPLGYAHVKVYGCAEIEVATQIAKLVKVIHPPGP